MRKRFLRVYEKAQLKNKYRFAYGKSGEFYHVDHVIPLHGENVCGLHVPWNLIVLPAVINMAKGTMIVQELIERSDKANIARHEQQIYRNKIKDLRRFDRPWGGIFE